MSRYIKQDDVFELVRTGVLVSNSNFESVCKAVGSLPTIDIVHCKDCKFKRLYDGETKYFYCALEDRPNRNWSVDEWNFCWWGERIEK